MKKYLNSDEMMDFLMTYHLAEVSEKVVNSWTDRGNMTKNEAKYLRTAITYTRKFMTEVLLRLDENERKKVAQRTIKASEKPILFLDEWMKQRIMGTYEKELETVKISREKFEKIALLSMKTSCEDCPGSFNKCQIYDMYEDLLLPKAERERNCPYAFLSNEKELEKQENLKRIEEERKLVKSNKSKRKQKKLKNRYDEDDEIIEYNFK